MQNNQKNNLKNIAEFIWEMVQTALTVIIVVYLVKTFLFQLFIVDGQSMEPTLHDKEMLLVDKLSYHFRSPHRGEIVIFQKPGEPSVNFIKRVIGLPGETVVIKNGKVYIKNSADANLESIEEIYLSPDTPTNGEEEVLVKENEVFVMGDNRTNSQDSRVIGSIPYKSILGRALFTYWPIKDATWLITPKYNLSLIFPESYLQRNPIQSKSFSNIIL